MKKSNKDSFVDDGRVIANMNVDGMPWYHPHSKNHESESSTTPLDLDRKGKFALIKGVVGAALLVASVFAIVFFLFILFCVKIWFV